jgi:hypothetical protein
VSSKSHCQSKTLYNHSIAWLHTYIQECQYTSIMVKVHNLVFVVSPPDHSKLIIVGFVAFSVWNSMPSEYIKIHHLVTIWKQIILPLHPVMYRSRNTVPFEDQGCKTLLTGQACRAGIYVEGLTKPIQILTVYLVSESRCETGSPRTECTTQPWPSNTISYIVGPEYQPGCIILRVGNLAD